MQLENVISHYCITQCWKSWQLSQPQMRKSGSGESPSKEAGVQQWDSGGLGRPGAVYVQTGGCCSVAQAQEG